VPQGSFLGSLLFLLYINDLPWIILGVNIVLYADDNILAVDKEEETLQHKITFVMQQLELQFCKNDLIVNIDKTRAISFHSHQNRYPSRPHIIFNNNEITYSSELQFLGLFIMENLTWHAQIHFLFASLRKIYYMIKSLRNVTSTQMIWNIYFAYFQSRLRYGIMFWGGEGKSVKIFRLQKKAIQLITGVHKRESCRHISREFQILTLASAYILEVLCFIKKYQENLKQNFRIHGHNTRNIFDLHTCYCSTVLYQRRVTNTGIKLFNKLPIQIKKLDSHKGFKREMKIFLLHNLFYTIEEFLHSEGI